MAGLSGKIETEVEIKVEAEKFYNYKKKTPYEVPNIASERIKGVYLDDGDWDTYGHGSVKTWIYSLHGKSGEFKEKLHVDDDNMKLSHIGIGGDVFKEYKSFVLVYHLVKKNEGVSLVKLSIEYEKLNESVPDPTNYLNLVANITKDIEAHLVQDP